MSDLVFKDKWKRQWDGLSYVGRYPVNKVRVCITEGCGNKAKQRKDKCVMCLEREQGFKVI